MIAIGSSPFQPAVGGQHAAAAEDRRITSPPAVSPTSRVGEGTVQDARTGQPDPRVLQPVPTGGPSTTERARSEPERPVADLGERLAAPLEQIAAAPREPLRQPVPPLTQFVEIPTETTAEIQRLREEARSAEAEEDRAEPGTPPADTAREASLRIGTSLSTLRQIETAEPPTLDIHR